MMSSACITGCSDDAEQRQTLNVRRISNVLGDGFVKAAEFFVGVIA